VEPFSGIHALAAVSAFLQVIIFLPTVIVFFFKSNYFIVLTHSFYLQNHHILSSLPPLPEGGDVSE
jgi:hypothetical protein